MVDVINYFISVSKNKPKSSHIQKYLFKNAIDTQDGLLETLLKQLQEEGVVVNYGDTNEPADLNCLKNPLISDCTGTVQLMIL